jgi:hypothetical protein
MTSNGWVKVQDRTDLSRVIECAASNVAWRIASWFPEAPGDVIESLDQLQKALDENSTTEIHNLATHLGISIQIVAQ